MGFDDFVKALAKAHKDAGYSRSEIKKGVRPHPDLNTVQDIWGTHHYYGGSDLFKLHGINPKNKKN